MAKKIVLEFEIAGVKQQLKTFADLKEAIKASEEQLQSAEFGSDAFQKQLAAIEELKEAYKDLGKTAEQTAQEEADAAEKASKATADAAKEAAEKRQAAADDFEKFAKGLVDAAAGIAIAFGATDEEAQAMTANLLKFQGIATGVKGAIEAVGVVTKNWAAIQKILNAVLFANPIGLIVLGVAALAAGIYLLIKNIDSVITYFSDWRNAVLALLGPIGWLILAWKAFNDEQDEQESEREKAANKAHDNAKRAIDDIKKQHQEFVAGKEKENEGIELKIEMLENEGKSTYELRKQYAENNAAIVQDTLESTKKMLLAKQEEFRVLAELAGMTKDAYAESIGLDYEKLVTDANTLLDKLTLEYEVAQSRVTKIERDEQEKRADAAEENLSEKQRSILAMLEAEILMADTVREKADAEIAYIKKKNEFLLMDKKLTSGEIILIKEQEANDIEAIEDGVTKSQREQLEKQKAEFAKTYDANLQKAIDTNKKIDEANKKKIDDETSRIAELQGKYNEANITETDAVKQKYQQQQSDLREMLKYNIIDEGEYKKLSIQNKADEIAGKLDIASTYAAAVNKLANDIFVFADIIGKKDEASKLARAKRQFQIKKGLDIVEAGISGAKAVAQGISQFGPPPSPLGIAAIASAGFITAAQIAKIASAKFEGGGSSSTSTPSIPSSGGAAGSLNASASMSPQFNPQTLYAAGANTTNMTPFNSSAKEVGPVQPVVIQNNISLSEINAGNATLTNLMAATTI